MASLMKYHGGKYKLAPFIISLMPQHRAYVEPFGGGASVLLQKAPCMSEVYNDLNSEVYLVFKTIRERGEELAHQIALTPFSRDDLKLAYEPCDDELEQCRRFLVRSHMAISTTSQHKNSGFRAAINSGDYCSQAFTFSKLPEIILQVRKRLNRVIIENTDAFNLFERYDQKDTLFFVDPPYLNETRGRSSVNHGYKHNMTNEQHAELCVILKNLKGKVILAGYENPLYDDFLQGWTKVVQKGFSESRLNPTTQEVFWINYKKQRLLFDGIGE